MPTMPKLFAAVLMAVLGYFSADKVAGHLPEEVLHGMLRPMTAVFGIFVGWKFLGKRVGDGLKASFGMGLSATVVLVIVSLGFFSGNEMLRRALRKSYEGPIEALQGMVQIGIDFSVYLFNADVIVVLLVGGALVGVLVELVSRRWS